MTRMNRSLLSGRAALFLLALALAGTGGRAQSATGPVLPPPFTASRPGENYTGIPFSLDTACRTQWVYWQPCFTEPNRPLLIEGIALRSRWGQTFSAKNLIPLQVHLSSATAPFRNLSREFNQNHGWNKVVAFHGRFDLPPQSPASAGSFNIAIPFQMPFLYQTGDPGLVVEVLVLAQPKGSYELDLATAVEEDHTPFGNAAGCPSRTTGKPLVLQGRWPVQAGGKLRLELTNGAPSQGSTRFPLLGLLGITRQGSWLGSPLPVDLAPYGAPGCFILTEPLLTTQGVTDEQGLAQINFPLPPMYELVGQTLYSQVLMVEPFANQLGLVLSGGVASRVTGPYPVARLFATSQTARVGSIQVGSVPVIRLTLR